MYVCMSACRGLEKPGQRVRQVSDEAKALVDKEAAEAARHLGQEALRRRLEERLAAIVSHWGRSTV